MCIHSYTCGTPVSMVTACSLVTLCKLDATFGSMGGNGYGILKMVKKMC